MPATKRKSSPKATKRPAKKAASAKKPTKASTSGKASRPSKTGSKPKAVNLLSGGNPQIPKGDGDAPVQDYIAAMPGWKRDIGKRLDAVITKAVPAVRKAVKWNSPMYGVEDGWFLGIHVYEKYVKVAFFHGAALRPMPPGESKQENVRYLDIREDGFDEAQFALWVKQAAELPLWKP